MSKDMSTRRENPKHHHIVCFSQLLILFIGLMWRYYMPKSITDYLKYGKYFNTADLRTKLTSVAKRAGYKVVYGVLLLYYASINPGTKMSDKAKIFGALGYFILPMDFIPDMMPMMGYTDDFAAITLALKAVWKNITPEVHEKARRRLSNWFGEIPESDLKIF